MFWRHRFAGVQKLLIRFVCNLEPAVVTQFTVGSDFSLFFTLDCVKNIYNFIERMFISTKTQYDTWHYSPITDKIWNNNIFMMITSFNSQLVRSYKDIAVYFLVLILKHYQTLICWFMFFVKNKLNLQLHTKLFYLIKLYLCYNK